MSQPVIRPLVFGDWTRIKAIWHDSAPSIAEDELAAYLLRNPGLSQVATKGKILVGVVLAGHDGWRGIVRWLAISPAHPGPDELAIELADAVLKRLGREGISECLMSEFSDSLWLGKVNRGWLAPKNPGGCSACPIQKLGPRINSLTGDS